MPTLLLLGPIDIAGPSVWASADDERSSSATSPQFGSPRLRCLLAALATRPNSIADASWLADILWGDDLPATGESALHNLVFRLRAQLKALGVQDRLRVVTAAPGYCLVVERSDVDTLLFTDLFRRACAVREADPELAVGLFDRAEALWHGEPFGEFVDAPWAQAEAEFLRQNRIRCVEEAASALISLDRASDAASRLAAVADRHPYRESLQRLFMEALWRADRPADALAAYARLRRRLAEDLGTEPAPRLRELHARILEGARPPPTTQPPPTQSPSTRPFSIHTATVQPGDGPSPLPDERDALVPLLGRDGDCAALAHNVRRSPLVTIVGTGGVGKTLLARHHAQAYASSGQGEVWFADLVGAGTPDAVVHTVAAAAGVRLRPDLDPAQALTAALRQRRGLLVLDNCEHVAEASGAVAVAVHRECPQVTLLATSRTPLGVDVEQVVPLAPLAVPQPGATDVEVADCPAVQLFCSRALARDAGFGLSSDNSAAVAEICRRLDGLPLAIELAATKARSIPPTALVDRLDWRLRVLRSPHGEPRHRSLQALIDWSFGLLAPLARRIFAVLSVFPARFTLADAEVLGRRLGIGSRGEVVDAVSKLVDASLLSVSGADYRMLESLRAFGAEILDDDGTAMAVRAAHAGIVSDWLRVAGRELYGAGHVDAAKVVADRIADVRQAVGHAVTADAPLAGRLFEGVVPYLELTMSPEVTGWARSVIEAPGTVDVGAAPFAVAAGGTRFVGELDAAGRFALAGLDRGPTSAVEVYLRMILVEVTLFRGELDAMTTHAATMMRLAATADMPGAVHMAELCVLLAQEYRPGSRLDGDGAVVDGQRAALAVSQAAAAAGETVIAHWAQYVAAECAMSSDPDTAAALFDTAIAGSEQTGDRYLKGVSMISRASIEARGGDAAAAARHYVEVIEHLHQTGNRTHLWVALRTVADVLVRLGRDSDAAVLLGAISQADAVSGAGAYGNDADLLRHLERQVNRRLGDRAGRLSMARGAAMAPDDVVAHAVVALRAAQETSS